MSNGGEQGGRWVFGLTVGFGPTKGHGDFGETLVF